MRGQFLLWSGGGGKGSQLLQLPITSTISFLMASNVLSACMIPMLNCHNIFVFWFLFSHNNNVLIEEFLCIVFFFSLATSWIEYLIVIVYDRNWVSVLGWNRKPRMLSFGFGITYSISSFFSAGQGWTSCFDFCLSFLFIYQRISYESEQHRNSSSMKCWSKTGSK